MSSTGFDRQIPMEWGQKVNFGGRKDTIALSAEALEKSEKRDLSPAGDVAALPFIHQDTVYPTSRC